MSEKSAWKFYAQQDQLEELATCIGLVEEQPPKEYYKAELLIYFLLHRYCI